MDAMPLFACAVLHVIIGLGVLPPMSYLQDNSNILVRGVLNYFWPVKELTTYEKICESFTSAQDDVSFFVAPVGFMNTGLYYLLSVLYFLLRGMVMQLIYAYEVIEFQLAKYFRKEDNGILMCSSSSSSNDLICQMVAAEHWWLQLGASLVWITAGILIFALLCYRQRIYDWIENFMLSD